MEAKVLKGFRGWETLECGQHLIHSAYDPQREAATLIQPALKTNPELLLIFGLGLGYHLECIAQRMKGVQVIVFEPSQEVYQIYLQKGRLSQGPRDWLSVTTHLEEFNEIFSKHYLYRFGDLSLGFLILPPYAKLFPEELARFKENLNRMVARRASNVDTIAQKKRLWLENFLENIPHLLESPDLTSLSGLFQNIPCFLVGAGPSLSKNVNFLTEAKDRGLIFCANAAFARLAQEGVQPEITGILEGIDVSNHVKGVNGVVPSYLAIDATSHPNHFAIEAKGKFVFHTQKWTAELLGNDLFSPHGGHVTSAGFTLAVILGCNPIILVGQDLAFDGKKLHAEGTMGPSFVPQGSERITLEGFDGKPVLSHRTMLSYLMWYEESAALLKRRDPQRILLNATEGGAKISGIPNVSLREAVEKFCRREVACEEVLKKYATHKPLHTSIPLIKVEELIGKMESYLKEYGRNQSPRPMKELITRCSFAEAFFQDIPEKDIDLHKALVYLNHLWARIKRYSDEKPVP